MGIPRHTTPPTPQDLETELGAICLALVRILPTALADGFTEGLRIAARTQLDAGHSNAGKFLEGLAAGTSEMVVRTPPTAH